MMNTLDDCDLLEKVVSMTNGQDFRTGPYFIMLVNISCYCRIKQYGCSMHNKVGIVRKSFRLMYMNITDVTMSIKVQQFRSRSAKYVYYDCTRDLFFTRVIELTVKQITIKKWYWSDR